MREIIRIFISITQVIKSDKVHKGKISKTAWLVHRLKSLLFNQWLVVECSRQWQPPEYADCAATLLLLLAAQLCSAKSLFKDAFQTDLANC